MSNQSQVRWYRVQSDMSECDGCTLVLTVRSNMVGKATSLNSLNHQQLVSISVCLEHYVELLSKDQFNVRTFQYRLEQHLVSPWKQPQKKIRTKLVISRTCLVLKRASWWPYRITERVDFGAIERVLTFEHASRFIVVGLKDDDFAEKEFVILSTRTIVDSDKIIRAMESQLHIWRNHPARPLSQLSLPTNLTGTSQCRLRSSGSDLISEPMSAQSSQIAVRKTRNFGLRQRGSPSNERPPSAIRLSGCICPNNQFPRIELGRAGGSEPPHHRRSEIHTPSSAIVSYSPTKEYLPVTPVTRSVHTALTDYRNSASGIRNHKSSQTPTNRGEEEKSWEVDIKYVRYDPRLGNVLDSNGPIYLYTAHEVKIRD
ncbi:unnamed protein product [Calicophoron daubneyi]|uniref:IRS-type PTB domain-containing protein n=1 Tax=Calicophoron daubneyi TaxID=300641 RepID=A0AAV2TKP7_CALDB